MGISKVDHYSIRTTDLEASRRFYTEILELRVGYRPPFPFPGLWLYRDIETDSAIVHVIGIDADDPESLHAYLGERSPAGSAGTGHFDHIAFLATHWPRTRA